MTSENYLKSLIEGLVEMPEAIEIKKEVDSRGTFLILKVAKNDMPTIVGKLGATVKSIKRLLWAFGAKEKTRINLKLEEPR